MAGERERISVVKARQLVRANSGVADTLPLRDLANFGPQMNIALSEAGLRFPSDAIIANRNAKILVMIGLSSEQEVEMALNQLPHAIDTAFQVGNEFSRLIWNDKGWDMY